MKSLPFFLLLIMTFGLAGLEKFLAPEVPDWFLAQFKNTLLDKLPGGLSLSFYLIAVLEIAALLILLIGLVKKEFLETQKSKQAFLRFGVFLSQIIFIALGFGQRLTHHYEAAGQLFFYAVLTFIAGHFALVADKPGSVQIAGSAV